MAKPLLVQTDRSPAKKITLSESVGGQPISVSIGAQIAIHTIPEGYRDEVHLWWNNTDAAADGAVLLRLGATASEEIIILAPFRETQKVCDGIPIEGVAGGLELQALGITEPGKLFGYVIRTAIEA